MKSKKPRKTWTHDFCLLSNPSCNVTPSVSSPSTGKINHDANSLVSELFMSKSTNEEWKSETKRQDNGRKLNIKGVGPVGLQWLT